MDVPYTSAPGTWAGSGARADVYRSGPYALKVFHPGTPPAQVFREAYVGALVAGAGLPAPRIYEVVGLDGRLAIKMDSMPGKTLHERLEQEPARWKEGLDALARLQAEVHQAPVRLPFALADWISQRIQEGKGLEEGVKARALLLLDSLPTGTALCHGDFHGGNVLADGAAYTVIDWANATAGHPDADACRTYMIYALHMPVLAERYLASYCACAGRPAEAVLRWLPVLAAARFSEGFPEEQEALVGWMGRLPV